MLKAWRGHERMMVIEMVRALDHIAFAFRLAPNCEDLVREDAARRSMLRGAATALGPFLEVLKDSGGGVPWGPTTSQLSDMADNYLLECGRLAELRRLTALERHGLAKTLFVRNDLLVIELESGAAEASDVEAGHWLRAVLANQNAEASEALVARKGKMALRIDAHVDVDNGWFIRYDSKPAILAYHQALAAARTNAFAEAEALPDNVVLGGWPFSHWRSASVAAQGRVFHHIAFATRLRATREGLERRNLLTVFARKEDVAAVWEEAGEDSAFTKAVISTMTLDGATAAREGRDHEIPLPFYVDIGRDFVLMPTFGALLNPFSGLVRQLRLAYRRDWDAGVDGREEIFRRDLVNLFPAPRFVVPNRGFSLSRSDGSELTDLDAIVLDRKTGSLVVVQLKWHDIYGRSLRERASRRTNLLTKGNEWVDKVADWIAGRSSTDVARALRLDGGRTDRRPEILVIARNAARFSGADTYDQRAAWLCWAELVRSVSEAHTDDILTEVAQGYRGGGPKARTGTIAAHTYALPGLTVEVRVGS